MNGTIPVVVRPADAADFGAVLGVFSACWEVSYRGVLPDTAIAAMNRSAAETLWRRVFATVAPGELLVAELPPGEHIAIDPRDDDRDVVIGVARWAVTDPGVGWLHSLYVAPTSQGAGIGAVLVDAVERRLAAAGASTAHLWAFAANERGRRFYTARGWVLDGETRVEDEFGELEVRFTKRLEDPR